MKYTVSKKVLKKYFEEREKSELADQIINEFYLSLTPSDTSRIRHFVESGKGSLSEAYMNHISSRLDPESRKLLKSVSKGYGLDTIRLLDPKHFTDNPYYQLLRKVNNFSKGNVSFRQLKTGAYVPVAFEEKVEDVKRNYADLSPIGAFAQDFYYPVIMQKKHIWMSFAPHDTETSEYQLRHAHGKVLTYGLGLGYFAYMAAEKENVESVTVIEFDQNIIDLFKANLLPLFPHPEKIRIIHGDAVAYGRDAEEHYDYLFADIWHDAEDGLPFYIRMKKNERIADDVEYWIEQDMLVYLRRHLIALMEEESEGSTDADYKYTDTFSDRLFKGLHFLLKNRELKTKEDIDQLLSVESLKDIAFRLPDSVA